MKDSRRLIWALRRDMCTNVYEAVCGRTHAFVVQYRQICISHDGAKLASGAVSTSVLGFFQFCINITQNFLTVCIYANMSWVFLFVNTCIRTLIVSGTIFMRSIYVCQGQDSGSRLPKESIRLCMPTCNMVWAGRKVSWWQVTDLHVMSVVCLQLYGVTSLEGPERQGRKILLKDGCQYEGYWDQCWLYRQISTFKPKTHVVKRQNQTFKG